MMSDRNGAAEVEEHNRQLSCIEVNLCICSSHCPYISFCGRGLFCLGELNFIEVSNSCWIQLLATNERVNSCCDKRTT